LPGAVSGLFSWRRSWPSPRARRVVVQGGQVILKRASDSRSRDLDAASTRPGAGDVPQMAFNWANSAGFTWRIP